MNLTREQIEEIRRTAFPYSWFNPLCDMAARTERAEAELAKWKDAERRLSDAYLRLRGILGAWETPNAPTAEQVWVHTEAKARELAEAHDHYQPQIDEGIKEHNELRRELAALRHERDDPIAAAMGRAAPAAPEEQT